MGVVSSSIRLEEEAVEDFRPAVAVAADLSPQVAGRRRPEGQTLPLPHALQEPGLVLEQEEILLPLGHLLQPRIHDSNHKLHLPPQVTG